MISWMRRHALTRQLQIRARYEYGYLISRIIKISAQTWMPFWEEECALYAVEM